MTSGMTLRAAVGRERRMSSHEFHRLHLNMIWSGSGSLREMERDGRRGREAGRAGQINTATFPPSFAPEYDLTTADTDVDFPLPFPSGFLMGANADRSISSESKKPLPSFLPSAHHSRLSLGESVRDTIRQTKEGGERASKRGSIILQKSLPLRPNQT